MKNSLSYSLTACVPRLMLAVLLSSCGVEFTEYNVLDKTRILAIRTDPPWVRAGAASSIDALIYTETPSTAVQFAWTWCEGRAQAGDDYACAETSLGEGPVTALDGTTTTNIFDALCPSGDCPEGVVVSVGLALSQDGIVHRAFKELRIFSPTSVEANENPTLLDVGRGPAEKHASIADARDFKLGDEHAITAVTGPMSSETYTPFPTKYLPAPEPRGEVLRLTWFVGAGETKWKRTMYMPGVLDIEGLHTNSWDLTEVEETRTEVPLFLVLRDNRGGVDWFEYRVHLVGGTL